MFLRRCKSYQGIKLLDHVMEVLERFIKKRVRIKCTTTSITCNLDSDQEEKPDAIRIVRQVQKRYLERRRICVCILLTRKSVLQGPKRGSVVGLEKSRC
jgi:hypothetical protein